ncbi:ribbon-helix-helix protein, CopG family [Brasilonema sp. CT11]|nr:ribbon-helix-helix protein, CopG family [Brasilonema sp. CT11]
MAVNNTTKGKKRTFIQVYMTEEEMNLLTEMANDAGMTKTELMRRFLQEQGAQFRNRHSEIQQPIRDKELQVA